MSENALFGKARSTSDFLIGILIDVCIIIPFVYAISTTLIKMSKGLIKKLQKDFVDRLGQLDTQNANEYVTGETLKTDQVRIAEKTCDGMFHGYKLKNTVSCLSAIGVIAAISVVTFGYRYNLINDQEFFKNFGLFPIKILLVFGALMLLIQLIYSWAGYGRLSNIYEIEIDKQVNTKNCMLLIYILNSIFWVPTGYYVVILICIATLSKLSKIII